MVATPASTTTIKGHSMRHSSANAILPSTLLKKNFLGSVHPSQTVPPSVAQYSAGLAHDARNMLAAMDIYCELLAAPGVLQPEHQHFLSELRLLRDSSGQLLDRLLIEALRCLAVPATNKPGTRSHTDVIQQSIVSPEGMTSGMMMHSEPDATMNFPLLKQGVEKKVTNVVTELQSMLPMLSALAGPKVVVSLALDECPAYSLSMPTVDFTRVLINLVRNATEAMSAGGRINISAQGAPLALNASMLLSIEDNGPGIPLSLLERIFEMQVSAPPDQASSPRMTFRPRGLGLRIVREFIEASHGTIRAVRLPERGSRFEIVLPVVTNTQASQ